MSLQRLYEGCTELLAISEGWRTAAEEKRSELLQRMGELHTEIGDLAVRHNEALQKLLRKHHPDDPEITSRSMKDPLEYLQVTFEHIDIPSDLRCNERLKEHPELEEDLNTLPAYVAMVYRFGRRVRWQVGSRLEEASVIHETNKHDGHANRLPAPAHMPAGHIPSVQA